MRHSHVEIAQRVLYSLEAYLRAVGPQALRLYADEEGYWQELNESGWKHIRQKLLTRTGCVIRLSDASTNGEDLYQFMYYGRPLDAQSLEEEPEGSCTMSFWLPTEYLEEHGPGRVRELALELAAPLPFCSGHAGLSFIGEMSVSGVRPPVRELCFRHPGLDIPDIGMLSWTLGTKVRGAYWLTFLGQPVLGELGGAPGLRARLSSPGSTVQELEGERVVVTLGKAPEAGDTEQGHILPAYRELARVLEPWFYTRPPIRSIDFPPESVRRWERRFLD
ncbi:MAG TPA: DUF3396 domain-containing protein [Myxococcaceae bacterium]|nr:DUF3396 domain-containing protein [Myxococcaceae bacterium]